ncbi:Crp/Fnr family transcriptional regulator [Paenibacillus sp. L3-i20]|uniref:Crp/Fnr family transcriptional regulator n=1 Tax=Paenibacillus sp. L3-i20 TaxID=2905833 RepID=UPI001EDD4C3B|nr:cyclic nucleotide-binding domain-containing protein [Paenibacillus sp. L3-i20]GKU78894.1 catabolite gene activator protein [Paenibacillus sp. L3-i20]
MKIILEQHSIQKYITQFNLDQIFVLSDSLPIHLRIYERNELVLEEGNELDGLYFQVAGRTKVSTSVGTGKSLLLRFCYPLTVFGDVELLQKAVIQSQVKAIEQTTFIFINKHTIETELMQNHYFLQQLLKYLSYRLQTCTTASRINLLASVEERFASYLLTIRLQNEFGKEMQTPNIGEIASLIGTTPRHLNRVIQKLSELKIISKTLKSIVVLNWERLDELSNGLRYD